MQGQCLSRGDVQFDKYRLSVVSDGVGAQAELGGDLSIGTPIGQSPGYFRLTASEPESSYQLRGIGNGRADALHEHEDRLFWGDASRR
jgi:hypothetical protein